MDKSGRTILTAVGAYATGEYFTPPGTTKPMPEFAVELDGDFLGFTKAFTFSEKLVQELEQGSQEVEWKVIEFQNDGVDTCKLNVKRIAPDKRQLEPAKTNGHQSVGSTATASANTFPKKDFHAAPENVALKIVELALMAIGDKSHADFHQTVINITSEYLWALENADVTA